MSERQLILSGEIEEKSVKDIITQIFTWNAEDEAKENELKNYNRPVIKLLVDSFGGNMVQGMGLASVIHESITPVHTICVGAAMSGGFFVLIAGHKRFCYPMASLMYHQPQTGQQGSLDQVNWELKELEKYTNKYKDFVVDNTKLTRKMLDKYDQRSHDFMMLAEEALKYGVVDEIIKKK